MRKPSNIRLTALVIALAGIAASFWLVNRPIEPQPIYNGRPLGDWLKDLDAFDKSKKRAAQHVVEGIGTNAIPDLLRMLKLKDPRSKSDAHLVGNWICRKNAAYVLGRFGPQAKSTVPRLVKLLRDPVAEVRYFAAQALGRIGPDAQRAIPKLMAVKAYDPDGGIFAEWAVEDIRSTAHSDAVLNSMSRATTNYDKPIAAPAVVCLRDAGLARLALPPLLEMLSIRGSGVYKESGSWAIYPTYAAERIGLLGPQAKEAVGPLTAALDDPSALVKLHAARALGEIGPEAKTAAPVLISLLSGKDRDWQGMDPVFWRGTVKTAVLEIAPDSATNDIVK